jgi:CheY-like chemotaxis protein
MLPPQVQMAFEALDKAGGDAGEVMQALQQQPQQPDPMAMLSAEKMAAEAQKTKAQAESVALDNQMKAGAMGLPPMPPQPAQG